MSYRNNHKIVVFLTRIITNLKCFQTSTYHFSDLLLVMLVGVVSAWTSTFEELVKLRSFWTCAGDTTNVAAWEVVLQGSMLRGAWKSLPCSLLPMKASITTPGFHHSRRLHELHGELQQGQAPLFNFPKLFVWLAWNAPVHILHLSTMDIYLEQFFWFWRVGSKPFVAYSQEGMKPSA